MRGEDFRSWWRACPSVGSPPHARGRHLRPFGRSSSGRITPACAGKTRRRGRRGGLRGDHPRMRGEDAGGLKRERPDWGSPPHARGRRPRRGRKLLFRRITPACAGKTRREGLSFTQRMDHPRMRGEDILSAKRLMMFSRSPPHARGRHPRPAL